ncbi:CBASS cGAMP synthase [Acinetobacter sp. V89_4]|uniref:CBASS cGAMP synthase n=1 Tax=Acinetobacter sp. V89_4 TaxID=3044232 RepID=UPI00249DC512|nr:CBASS cGAMP synthase [Acinetobacter sp. V89_4]MDI3454153.1 CBASS cGAMP synthase [Acinetobacter sp. V89_4]
MNWNFHQYYSNRTDGLMGQLLLSDREKDALKALRDKVRERTRDIFVEAKQLVKQAKKDIGLASLRVEMSVTNFKYLSLEDQNKFAELIIQLDSNAKAEFLKLTPRFWTQGSFTYNTLNKPYVTPPQEMDIDDGTYLPMVFFNEKPIIAHHLLLLLVDTSLKSLVAENPNWTFEAKRTCGRITIPYLNAHVDVPMYAIPEDKFLEKEQFFKAAANTRFTYDGYDSVSVADQKKYKLDSDCVNLAIRADDQKWMKSDPKVVLDWFEEHCSRTGTHLRKICRFLKAWRDAQWETGGGPSSISLMAATVSILNRKYVDHQDFGSTMLTIARELPNTFRNGVESPDPSDERPLFPSSAEHQEREREIIAKMEILVMNLENAFTTATKQEALNILNANFGDRVTDSSLIVPHAAAPAFETEASKAVAAVQINPTMKSG